MADSELPRWIGEGSEGDFVAERPFKRLKSSGSLRPADDRFDLDCGSSPMPGTVLLIQDDPGLVKTLANLLQTHEYRVESVRTGEEGLRLACEESFDVIVLDVMPPGLDGFEVCRRVRRLVATPILMLSARSGVKDRVEGLRLGADDYLPKPFEALEFLARLEALIRRSSLRPIPDTHRFGSVVVDFRGAEVRRKGMLVPLAAREYRLLRYFIENRGAALSRQQLLRDVWGYKAAIFTRTVDAHVKLLRRKLEENPGDPQHFLTVRGLGYKFIS